jgi:acetoin utilization deacetylase AcuC-like enzyme
MKIGLIALVQDEKHQAPAGHPETAHRLVFALNHVMNSDIASSLISYIPLEVEAGTIIGKIHDEKYISILKKTAENGGGYLDGDTYVTTGSFAAAWETAETAVAAVNDIIGGKFKRIFLAGRPPGHHAEYNHGMGFCLINNTAVAAEAAVTNHKLARVAIVDWDVHHGNGTQHSFYDRSDIYFISLHRYPFYPGSGATSERGTGKGEGFTLNIPLPQGTGGEIYLRAFAEKIIPALEKYAPELIIITAGFDAHRDDPLGGMDLDGEIFGEMTRQLVNVANQFCDGRILSLFEGGYSLPGNAQSLYFHLTELMRK